jgi:hypothetical protein
MQRDSEARRSRSNPFGNLIKWIARAWRLRAQTEVLYVPEPDIADQRDGSGHAAPIDGPSETERRE